MLTDLLAMFGEEELFSLLLESKPFQELTTCSPLHGLRSSPAQPAGLSDITLLKRLIPNDLYKELMSRGPMGMHALSFALRYRVCRLQDIFHRIASVQPGSTSGDHWLSQEASLEQSFAEAWMLKFSAAVWPLFGFSALGIHCSWQIHGRCRAFDALLTLNCQKPSLGAFCVEHQDEAYDAGEQLGSKQAIMFRYYGNLDHFNMYSEAELQRMTDDFWRQMGRSLRSPCQDLHQALLSFGYSSSEDLQSTGLNTLRRRYLRLAVAHHPDHGGQAEAFVTIQTHYQTLREHLRSRA